MQSVDVVVCETCRRSPEESLDGLTSGRAFAAALGQAVAGDAELSGTVAVTTTRCLMSCARSCSVAVRAPGRMSYVLGDLGPEADTVGALVDYLRGYVRSADGVVPFRQWPDGIKGRFVARIPPA